MSQEQTSGIEQINMAVSQMDQVTQQNASLVEEAAAAAEAMQNQAAQLAQVVAVTGWCRQSWYHPAMNVFDFHATALDGSTIDLARYRGQVLLIVNTASACGFTPQYQGLEEVYRQFQARGVTVLGFPCNQFGHQEPGGAAEIGAFCEKNYGVSFPLFAKVDVNGPAAHPLFQHLKQSAPGVLGTELIKWNFTKFLVARDGTVFRRYAPQTKPEAIVDDIEGLLVR